MLFVMIYFICAAIMWAFTHSATQMVTRTIGDAKVSASRQASAENAGAYSRWYQVLALSRERKKARTKNCLRVYETAGHKGGCMDTTFQVKDRKSLQDLASLLTAEGFIRLRIAGTVESRTGPWKWRHTDGRTVLVELTNV